MGSGLSMTSVNKIKELAARREYESAVDILDSQDLEKSLNPQFISTCGDIYEHVGRSREARHLQVKAHSMAPESSHIIFKLIEMYLRRGYFSLAETYYNQYLDNSVGSPEEALAVKYLMAKSKGQELDELYDILYPKFRDDMYERWSFELFLVSSMLSKPDLEMFAADYRATFKDSPNSDLVKQVYEGQIKPEDVFEEFRDQESPDDDPDEEDIRKFEIEQLKQDEKRLHPEAEEAVITEIMPDEESDENNIVKNIFKKKYKNSLEEEADSEEVSDEELEEKLDEGQDNVTKGLKSFIRNTFLKKKVNADESESAEDSDETKDEENADKAKADDAKTDDEKSGGDSADAVDSSSKDETEPSEDSCTEKPEVKAEMSPSQADDESEEPEEEKANSDEEDKDSEESKASVLKRFGRMVIKEAKDTLENQKVDTEPQVDLNEQSILSFVFDDGFAPESDTISDLADDESSEEFVNPFDEIEQLRQAAERQKREEQFEEEAAEEVREEPVEETVEEVAEEVTEEPVEETVEEVAEEVRKEPVEETVEEAAEEVREEPVEEMVEEVAEEVTEEPVEEVAEEVAEETVEETVEEVAEEVAEEPVEETVEEVAEEVAEETVEETVEEVAEEVAEEPVEETVEEVAEEVAEETVEETVEEVAEEVAEETVEETTEETTEAVAEEANEESNQEPIEESRKSIEVGSFEDSIESLLAEYTEKSAEESKGSIDISGEEVTESEEIPVEEFVTDASDDFPEFKTNLFPNRGKGLRIDHNQFEQIEKEEKQKLSEGLEEEEQKLQEAKDLLASLGIKI